MRVIQRDRGAAAAAVERKQSNLTTILTVIVAAAIIVVGFITPSVFYSAMDSDRDTITVLTDSSNDDVSSHVFDEPVSLYPWNLYDRENTSTLTYADRAVLFENNIPNFLLTTMAVYGMDVEQLYPGGEGSSYYLEDLMVDAFSFLLTNPETNQGCYVINSLDVNLDEIADLRCAVDLDGNIISLLFLSSPWSEASKGPAQNSIQPEEGTQTNGEETGPAETTPTSQEPPSSPSEDGAAEAAEGDAVAEADGEPVDAPLITDPYALTLDGLTRTPVGEELAIWSYVHILAHSAAQYGQRELEAAATFLDAGFAERYLNTDDTGVSQPSLPTPTVFATEEYALYIYDLPTDVRFILYFDPASSRCVGFNLQL